MPAEPTTKRAITFFDGQNLFYAIKEAFGYSFPNYDPRLLSERICSDQGWELNQIRFYTGVPDITANPTWHHFWSNKISYMMGKCGIECYHRRLSYRNQTIPLPDGATTVALVGQEKGIDIRIALDAVSTVRKNLCDVVLIFSQDQDLTELVEEVRMIAQEQNRWVKIASAFPTSPTYKNKRGINKTDWIKFDRTLYDACIDPRDYRPKVF